MNELNPIENIHPILIGLAVDYLSRFMVIKNVGEAFKVSLLGAFLVKEKDKFIGLIRDIKGLDNKSIINAVKVCGYDVAFRAGPMHYKPVDTINPDFDTIENIRIMVNRSLFFSFPQRLRRKGLKNQQPYPHAFLVTQKVFLYRQQF